VIPITVNLLSPVNEYLSTIYLAKVLRFKLGSFAYSITAMREVQVIKIRNNIPNDRNRKGFCICCIFFAIGIWWNIFGFRVETNSNKQIAAIGNASCLVRLVKLVMLENHQ